jgi:heme-degrading monooxygenase HmoA
MRAEVRASNLCTITRETEERRRSVYAGVVSVQLKVGKAQEATQIYQDSVAPELRQMRGFQAGYVLTNAETGKGYIIGLWDTQEDAQSFESSGAFREQAAKFEDMLDEPASREVFEVSAQA